MKLGSVNRACGILVFLLLAACSSSKPQAGINERYMVKVAHTPFYRYGPAQGVGATGMLDKGAPVILLSQSFGYSRVMLENGISAYVSNDAIAPAPAEPKATPTPAPLALPKHRKHASEDLPPPSQMEQPLGLPEMPSDPLPGFRY